MFFVMSRCLSPKRISRLIITIFLLFILAFGRDAFEYFWAGYEHKNIPWLIQNAINVFGIAAIWTTYHVCIRESKRLEALLELFKQIFIEIAGIAYIQDKSKESMIDKCINRESLSLYVIAVIAIIRMIIDYKHHWSYYFPEKF